MSHQELTIIRIIERDMTAAEFSRRCAGANGYAREQGCEVQIEEKHSFVLMDGDTFIGCAVGTVYRHGARNNGWMYLADLYLEKPYRKHGFGRLLLTTLE